MLAVTGYSTTIVKELSKLVGNNEEITRISYVSPNNDYIHAERYVLAAGKLHGKSRLETSLDEANETWIANFFGPIGLCDMILERNDTARIVVIGSDSGINGSYDTVYAGAKAALHHYVRTKKTEPNQQLVCVAPSIIENSGMTERREDRGHLNDRRERHPKGRFLQAIEVARLVHYLLYVDLGYLTGTVIEMHGGRA